MSYIPIELRCTAKKPDGTLAYGTPRVVWQGRVHTWRDSTDRTAFFTLIRQQMSAITGKDLTKLGVTWTITSAAEMAQVLADYPGGGEIDDDIVAELKAQSVDLSSIEDAVTAPPA